MFENVSPAFDLAVELSIPPALTSYTLNSNSPAVSQLEPRGSPSPRGSEGAAYDIISNTLSLLTSCANIFLEWYFRGHAISTFQLSVSMQNRMLTFISG